MFWTRIGKNGSLILQGLADIFNGGFTENKTCGGDQVNSSNSSRGHGVVKPENFADVEIQKKYFFKVSSKKI